MCLGTLPADHELFLEDSLSSSSVLERKLERPECDIVKLKISLKQVLFRLNRVKVGLFRLNRVKAGLLRLKRIKPGFIQA